MQNGRLQRIETGIISNNCMLGIFRSPVIRQHTYFLGEGGVIGGDDTAIAQAAKVLTGIKAKACNVAKGADHLTIEFSERCLGDILDNFDVTRPADFDNLIHGCRMTKQVHGDHGLGVWCDGLF